MNEFTKKLVFALIIIIAFAIPSLLKGFFARLEMQSLDWRISLSADGKLFSNKFNKADDRIVIISADNLTQTELSNHPEMNLGKWPYKRSVWADVIHYIEQGKPKVVALDILFSGSEAASNGENPEDAALSSALQAYDNIVIGTSLNFPATTTPIEKAKKLQNPNMPARSSLLLETDSLDTEKKITYYSHTPIPEEFTRFAEVGAVNTATESSAVIRHSQPIYKLIKENETYYLPSFPYAILLKYIGATGEKIGLINNKLIYRNYVIPLNSKGRVFINWHGERHTYTHIPLSRILVSSAQGKNYFEYEDKEQTVDFFKDKIVIIAQTQENSDIHITPIDQLLPGAEVNANIIDNYLNDADITNYSTRKFINIVPGWINAFLAFAFCIMIIIVNLSFSSTILGILNSALLIFVYILTAMFAFLYPEFRYYITLVLPIYFMTLSLIVSFVIKILKEQQQKAQIKETFEKFVSKSVLENLLSSPGQFSLKTARKKITIMFCDVNNFTEISEKNEPEKVLERLNEIFNIIVPTIFEHKGTVDKLIGDSVMAYWGDPIQSKEDSLNAVLCAIEIQKRIQKLNSTLESEIKMGVKIAINTGDALVGCIGAEKIQDYTVFGDTINTAARIEGICSSLRRSILISQSTYSEVKNHVQTKTAGGVFIKGKEERLSLYEVIAKKETDD